MIVDNLILEKSIGKGNFGEVFLTLIKGDKTEKYYATKKLDRAKVEGTEALKYIRNELHILQVLDHPNIVKFETLKKTKKHYYIVMEYCNGGELSEVLEKYISIYKKPFSQEIVQHLMRQIIDAFKYIHENKIIHRDIKLDNILLHFESNKDKNNLDMMKAQIKIIDFGFSCFISKNGLLYSTLGSPINMDPIILKKLSSRNKKDKELGYDQKADIWSLGTICYEMLIGKSAFDAEDMNELVQKVEEGTYTVPTSLSKEMVSFINGMLQYDSSSRLTCEELSRHPFLTKDICDFHKIDIKQVSKKVGENGLNINIKQNKSIWAIFNADDEVKLLNIDGKEFEENEEVKRAISQNDIKKEKDEDDIHITIRRENSEQISSKENIKESKGPILPTKGIPGNPNNKCINNIKESQYEDEFNCNYNTEFFDS